MTGHPAARAEAVSPPATENASGEVAGTEDRHRTEGRVAEPQVRARHGLAVGNGVIDPKVRPFAGARHVGEELEPPDSRCAPIRIGEPWHPLQPARRSTSPVPSRYPYLRVSGMISEAASPMATIPATYQANHCS